MIRWRLSRSTRLIDALKERVSSTHSAKSLKRALESNVCRVNGRVERFGSILLQKGDLIELAPQWEENQKARNYPILYEDDDLLILNKPAGVVCTDAVFHKELNRPIYLAHRLDKDTTGALLFGKNRQVARELQSCFEKKVVEKEYLALVDGVPQKDAGTIISYFVKKGSFQGQTIWGSTPSKQGLFAETSWKLEKAFEKMSLLRCFPKTGRTHQIRVHLAEMGHPILVDRQYASHFRSSIFATRPLLHASRLQFDWKGKLIQVEAALPQDFTKFL